MTNITDQICGGQDTTKIGNVISRDTKCLTRQQGGREVQVVVSIVLGRVLEINNNKKLIKVIGYAQEIK